MQRPQLPADNNCMMLGNRGPESGASLAEAALLVAVIAVVAASALSFLGSRSDGTLDEAGKGIHEGPTVGGGGGSGGDDGGGGGSGGGGSGGGGSGGAGDGGTAGTVPGTAPPSPTSTAPPATTTTVAPTSTTSTTSTTSAPPAPAAAELGNGHAVRSGSSRWNASADLQLALAEDNGGSLAGTATVRVQQQRSNGQWTTDTIEVGIDDLGRAVIETGPHVRSGSSRITAVRYTVVGIELAGEGSWDGQQPTITIGRP
jgi:Flp pilus assembly pilin Flp